MPSEEISGIEVSNQIIKIFQGKVENGTFHISKLYIKNSSSLPDALSQLPTLIKELDTKEIILFIPRNKFSVRYLSLPTKNANEISSMVKFKAKKQFLYAQKEVVHSFTIIGTDARGHSKVMLVVSSKDAFEDYIVPFKKLRVKPVAVTMNSLGVVNWYKLLFPQEKRTICLIDLDWNETNVCILTKGKFIYSREISRGVESIRGGPQAIDDLIMQIRRSVSAYTKEDAGPKIEAITVTGAVEEIEKLSSKLKETSELEINAISPLKKVSFDESINDTMIQVSNRISLAKILGALSDSENFNINFLAEQREQKEERLIFYKEVTTYTIIFVLLISSIVTITWWEFHRKLTYLQQTHQIVQKLQIRIDKLRTRKEIVGKVLSHLKRDGTVLNVLKEVAESLPEGVSLKRFNYKYDKRQLSIDGIAKSSQQVTTFIRNLQSSSLFSTVSQKYVRGIREDEKTFAIEITFLR